MMPHGSAADQASQLHRPLDRVDQARRGVGADGGSRHPARHGPHLHRQYTSHMSGILSAMADNLALGALGAVLLGLAALLPFILGAACSAILINWGRRRGLGSLYATPLMLEAALLFSFGILGWLAYPSSGFVAATVPLLCFIMGLQNATITKISGARMRTTHVTGIVTDIGIELGKLVYWNRDRNLAAMVRADREKLRLLALLLVSFFIGGITGAIGFSHIGFLFSLPFAALLVLLACPPLVDDVVRHGGQARQG
jgi:uncharacterized membrane protein YoaK (UPF0700 family)